MPVTSLDTLILSERPAAIHYCAKSNCCSKLVVSTYDLNDGVVRKGSLWFVDDSKNVTSFPMSAGVFRFDVFPDERALVASLTNGCISTVNLESMSASDLLVNADSMLLSVSIYGQKIVSSDNQGNIYLIDLTSEAVESFPAARLKYTNESCELWTTTWHNDGKYVISGGEDALLKIWDIRCDNRQPVSVNLSHESGVTFTKAEADFYLVTGSYDEKIRRFDYRCLKQPILQSNLGGGVWNVEETSEAKFLAACMFNGWALLDKTTFAVLEQEVDIGKTTLYGATECGDPSLIASCTFSDYTVHFHQITN